MRRTKEEAEATRRGILKAGMRVFLKKGYSFVGDDGYPR